MSQQPGADAPGRTTLSIRLCGVEIAGCCLSTSAAATAAASSAARADAEAPAAVAAAEAAAAAPRIPEAQRAPGWREELISEAPEPPVAPAPHLLSPSAASIAAPRRSSPAMDCGPGPPVLPPGRPPAPPGLPLLDAGRERLEQLPREPMLPAGPQGPRLEEDSMIPVDVGGELRMLPLSLLRRLAAQAEARKNPARPALVATLPTQVVSSVRRLGEQTQCTICLGDFAVGETLKTIPCLHVYHSKCIDRWLSEDNSCPICKTPVG